MTKRLALAASLLALISAPAFADENWVVKQEWVSAHENFLAGPALQGRGSATRDEAIAASYVAAQYEAYGLKPAPGMTTYLQTARVSQIKLSGKAHFTAGDVELNEGAGLKLYYSGGKSVSGTLQVATGDDPANVPAGDVVLLAGSDKVSAGAWIGAASAKGAKLVIIRENDSWNGRYEAAGGTRTPSWLTEHPEANSRPEMIIVSPEVFDKLKAARGNQVTLDLGAVAQEENVTTNAIGYLKGSDPAAGTLLITAHLDHLGVKGGVVMHGANDDASGVAAVLELAHAMAAGGQPKRSILFVCYGSEELGLLGSEYFAEHPPIPLSDIVANLEIEMIGQQDPKMPEGVMMMTGFERSDFGPSIKAKGALVAPDLYPEQNFFQRSDNYQLALKGIVAHTISGWAVTPSYHSADDTIANLNLPFMTRAIQSLVEPLRWLASSDYKPQWTKDGRPTEE